MRLALLILSTLGLAFAHRHHYHDYHHGHNHGYYHKKDPMQMALQKLGSLMEKMESGGVCLDRETKDRFCSGDTFMENLVPALEECGIDVPEMENELPAQRSMDWLQAIIDKKLCIFQSLMWLDENNEISRDNVLVDLLETNLGSTLMMGEELAAIEDECFEKQDRIDADALLSMMHLGSSEEHDDDSDEDRKRGGRFRPGRGKKGPRPSKGKGGSSEEMQEQLEDALTSLEPKIKAIVYIGCLHKEFEATCAAAANEALNSIIDMPMMNCNNGTSPTGNWTGPTGNWTGPTGNWTEPTGNWTGPTGNWTVPTGNVSLIMG